MDKIKWIITGKIGYGVDRIRDDFAELYTATSRRKLILVKHDYTRVNENNLDSRIKA